MGTPTERYEALVEKRDGLKDDVVQAEARLTALDERKEVILSTLKEDYSIEDEDALSTAIDMLDTEVEKDLQAAEAVLGAD